MHGKAFWGQETASSLIEEGFFICWTTTNEGCIYGIETHYILKVVAG